MIKTILIQERYIRTSDVTATVSLDNYTRWHHDHIKIEISIPWRQWQIFALLLVVTRCQQLDAVCNCRILAPVHFHNGEYTGGDRLDRWMHARAGEGWGQDKI